MDTYQNLAPNVLSTTDLVDEIAMQDAILATAKKRRDILASELLSRAGDAHYIDGHLHTATVVSEGITWTLDQKRIKEQMGESWLDQFSKHSIRKAYIKVTARKVI